MSTVELTRDPYARTTLTRTHTTDYGLPVRSCSWCGSRPGRFVYHWESDSVGPTSHPDTRHRFCSVGCYRSHNE